MTDTILRRRDGESDFRYEVRLCVAKLDKELDLSWEQIRDHLKLDCSADHLRKISYGYRKMVDNELLEEGNIERVVTEESQPDYKENLEILGDGTQKSDKLIQMSMEDSKDVSYLLKAHGYNPNEWELVNAKNSIWNVNSKKNGVQTLFSSKITAKPKTNAFNYNKFLELIDKKVKPIHIETQNKKLETPKLLEIPLYDMHFGVSNLEYYKHHLEEVINKLNSRHWEKVLFVIGQDLLHNDNFKGQTASGTIIDKVNMENAFDEALSFYETLITKAIKQSNSVECIYVKGNHDESISYGLFRTLKATFKQVKFDSSLKQRKVFTWEKVFIGLSHGDKGQNRILENFISEHGKLLANADVKEVHLGHLHTEKSKDQFGITQRTLSTANKTDDWHDDNGFVGANKRFQLFEYSPNSLDAIYYIQN